MKKKYNIIRIFLLLIFALSANSIKAIDNIRIYPSFYAITYPETYLNTFPMANLMGVSASIRAIDNVDFSATAAFQAFHDSYIITKWRFFSIGTEYQLFSEKILEYHYYPRFGVHVDYYTMNSQFDEKVSSVGFTVKAAIDFYFPNKVFLTPEFGVSYVLKMPEYAKAPLYVYGLSIGYHISINGGGTATALQDEEDEKKKLE
ncbi:MAG: hypothetical protein OEZ13_01140 [Spirochaetia bacterium]|nr:hypothetical protein [Spirochaetia bacterium]